MRHLFPHTPSASDICTGEILKVWGYRKANLRNHDCQLVSHDFNYQTKKFEENPSGFYVSIREWFYDEGRSFDNHITFLVRLPSGHVVAYWWHDNGLWIAKPEDVIVRDW